MILGSSYQFVLERGRSWSEFYFREKKEMAKNLGKVKKVYMISHSLPLLHCFVVLHFVILVHC